MKTSANSVRLLDGHQEKLSKDMGTNENSVTLLDGHQQKPDLRSEDTTAVRVTPSHCLRILQTVTIYASGLMLGFGSGVIGPTMVHVTLLYESDMAEMTRGIAAYNVTYFIGALLTALVFDCFNARLLHAVALFIVTSCIGMAPFMPHLYAYHALMATMTLMQGVVQSSVPGILLKLWHNHKLRSPVLQLYYMIWGSGVFLCPLLVIPFLAELPLACRILKTAEPLQKINESNFEMAIGNLSKTFDVTAGDDPCAIDVTEVRYVYVTIAAVGCVVTLLNCITFVTMKPSLKACGESSTAVPQEESQKSLACVKSCIKLAGVTIYFFMMFVTYFPNMFMSAFAIRGLGWSSEHASLLTSLFSGTQWLGRGLAVPLVYVLKPTQLLSIYYVITTCAYVLMALTPMLRSEILWISVALGGFSSAPMNSILMLWMGQYVTITSTLGSLNFMMASVAGSIGALLLGYLFEMNHMWVVYFSIVSIVCMVSILSVTSLFLRVTGYGDQLKRGKVTDDAAGIASNKRQEALKQIEHQAISSQLSLY